MMLRGSGSGGTARRWRRGAASRGRLGLRTGERSNRQSQREQTKTGIIDDSHAFIKPSFLPKVALPETKLTIKFF
jgi:hypothetical protein